MLTYLGRRFPTHMGCRVWMINELGSMRILPKCLGLRAHSPSGFEWGYGGSGPHQLALALLVNATGQNDIALAHYNELVSAFVSKLPQWVWLVRQESLIAWVDERVPIGWL